MVNNIKKILVDKKISLKIFSDLLEKEGIKISVPALSNKISRDSFSLNEYVLFCNILGYKVKTFSEEGFEYINTCNKEKELKKKKNL